MNLTISCPHCQSRFQVGPEWAGKRGQCRSCGGVVQVPAWEEPIEVELTPIESPAVTPRSHATSTTRSASGTSGSGATHAPSSPSAPRSAAPAPASPTAATSAQSHATSPAAASSAAPGSAAPTASRPRTSSTAATQAASSPTRASLAASTVSTRASTAQDRFGTLTPEQVLAAFTGPIPPVRSTLTYKLGILLVTLVMIVLPVIYVCLIGAVCFAVYWHLANHTGIFAGVRGKGAVLAMLIYAAPAAIGGILIAFMIKPLFAKSSGGSRTRSLTPQAEPLLFAFVDRICAAVGSTRPKRIDVTCDVNASAGFRRGVWSMLLGGDLVLTIGMPLVAGLTMRQFAGVLAHEFGHFSQGVGMRLSYVIRAISMWFTRVVYERDSWDEWLENASKSLDLRIGWILYLSRFLVWLTRRVLWVLMITGHAVAGYLLRQMEFDADRFEARLAGSDTFESTCRRLAVLNLASDAAFSDLNHFFREGRLGDNLPKLTIARVSEMPDEVRDSLMKMVDESETGVFDSHPCDRDRIASAYAEQAPGIFRLDRPASELFNHYDALCRGVTEDMYRANFGPSFNPNEMHSTDDLLVRKQSQKGDMEALERFFLDCFRILRPVQLPANALGPPSNPKQALADIKSARERQHSLYLAYRETFRQYDDADTHVFEAASALALHRASVVVPRDMFKFPTSTRQEVETVSLRAMGAMQAMTADLEPFETFAARRLWNGLQLLYVPQVEQRIPEASDWRAEAARLIPLIQMVNAMHQRIQEIRNVRAAMGNLFSQVEGNHENSSLIQAILDGNKWLAERILEVRRGMDAIQYPFDHGKGTISLGEYLTPTLADPEDFGATFDAANQLLERLASFYARMIGRLTMFAERVESVAGLAPLEFQPTPS